MKHTAIRNAESGMPTVDQTWTHAAKLIEYDYVGISWYDCNSTAWNSTTKAKNDYT